MRFTVIDNGNGPQSTHVIFEMGRWEIKLEFGVALYINLLLKIDYVITSHDIQIEYFL